jgi:multiple sugar transport system substrate-binding protein
MQRRNRIAVVITAVAVAVTMAGCSTSQPATSPSSTASGQQFAGQTLTALVAAAGAGLTSQYDEYYSALSAEFKAETGATLKLQYYNGASEENSIIQTSLVSNTGPDLVGYGSSAGATLAATGGFVKLSASDWQKAGGKDSWNPSTLSASDGIGVPSFAVPYVIAYNTDLFRSAGISGPPTTWDEWLADAKKVQAANPGVYGAGFDPADATDPWKFVWSYAHQLGGGFASKDGKKATLDSTPVKTAIKFYFSQFSDEGIVPPESLTWTNAQMVSAFTSGKVAMLPIATPGILTAAANTPAAGKIAFAQLPSVPAGMKSRPQGGTPAASIVSGQFWAVFDYAKDKKDLALALAKASNSPTVVEAQYKALGWMPTTKASIASLAKSSPEAAPFLAIQSKMEATELTPAWSTLQAGVSTTMNKVANNLAVTKKWSDSFLDTQLQSAQAAAQALMK